MAGRTWMTEKQIQEMKEYANEGFSYKEIAEAMNVSQWTVSRHLGKKNVHTFITDDLISKMENLRSQGLSNAQIAIEMGINQRTVREHIGTQKKRSEYGSLVAHVTGESFVKEDKMVRNVERKLKLTNTSISCEGKDFSYKASTDGRVRITSSTGIQIDLTKDQLLGLIAELCEIGDWLAKNSLSDGVCFLEP